jgi:hypothetical protein
MDVGIVEKDGEVDTGSTDVVHDGSGAGGAAGMQEDMSVAIGSLQRRGGFFGHGTVP